MNDQQGGTTLGKGHLHKIDLGIDVCIDHGVDE